MDFAIMFVVILVLAIVELIGLYFIFSYFVRPQKVGVLIRFLWSLFLLSVGVYLIFGSPVSIKHYFSVGYSWGFLSVIGVTVVLLAVIWISMLARNNNN